MIRDVDKYGELCFTGLWERVGADATPDSEYKKLAETYLEGHRVYHSLQHIMHGIREFEKAKHLIENPDQVLFALWYHDFVMKKKSRVDVERSSQVAYNVCKTALLSDEFAENVKKLILMTRHNTAPSANDEKFMIDIDLSILGSSPEEFARYEKKIREEYSWAPDDEFKKRRAGILQGFLDRPAIYNTELFREKYEAQARTNLTKSINDLKK
jgi:predicted metal-dependent HD superfamily phosphohydrolase